MQTVDSVEKQQKNKLDGQECLSIQSSTEENATSLWRTSERRERDGHAETQHVKKTDQVSSVAMFSRSLCRHVGAKCPQ